MNLKQDTACGGTTMKKRFLIGLALMIILTGCMSTKNPVSNKKLQEDCLAIQAIHNNLIEMISFKVDSTAAISDSFVARVIIDFKTELDTVSSKVIMHYKRHDQSWYLNSNEIVILSVESEAMPTAEMVKEKAQTINSLYNKYEAYSFMDDFKVTEKSSTGNGIVTFDFSIEGSEDYWSYHSEGTIEASYKLGQRWTYAVIKDHYSETTDWSGTYHIYPNNTFVDEGWVDPDMIEMTVIGSCTQAADEKGNNEISCDLSGSMNGKGVHYQGVYGQFDHTRPVLNSRAVLFGADDTMILELGMAFSGGIPYKDTYFFGSINGQVAAVHKIQ